MLSFQRRKNFTSFARHEKNNSEKNGENDVMIEVTLAGKTVPHICIFN